MWDTHDKRCLLVNLGSGGLVCVFTVWLGQRVSTQWEWLLADIGTFTASCLYSKIATPVPRWTYHFNSIKRKRYLGNERLCSKLTIGMTSVIPGYWNFCLRIRIKLPHTEINLILIGFYVTQQTSHVISLNMPELGRFWADAGSIGPETAQFWHIMACLQRTTK